MNDETLCDQCFRCDYDLRGIADDQPCPECGLLAIRSRRPNDEIQFTRPAWLKSISRGAWMLLIAVLLALIWPFIAEVVVQWLQARERAVSIVTGRYTAPSSVEMLLPMSGLNVAGLLLLLGVFGITRRENDAASDQQDRKSRLFLRLFVFVPLAAILFVNAILHASSGASTFVSVTRANIDLLVNIAFVLATIGTAPLPLVLFLRLRNLAKRARSAHLAEHCAIVGLGMTLSLLYTAGAVFVIEHAKELGLRDNWQNNSDASLFMMLLAALGPVLFGIWSLYLLARFAIRFGKVSRARAKNWRRDDESATRPRVSETSPEIVSGY